MALDISVKIIALRVAIFLVIITVIVTLSSSFANDLLKERIQNQFFGEASNRGEIVRYLINTYTQQIDYLNHQLSNDYNIVKIVEERESELANNNITFKGSNSTSILKQVIDSYNLIWENSVNIEHAQIFNKNGIVLLSTNTQEVGKKISNNDMKYYSNLTKNTIEKFSSKDTSNKTRQIITFISPFNVEKKSTNDFFISTSLGTNAFDNVLHNRQGLGYTGEVYLVNNSNNMITQSRFLNNDNPITVNTFPVQQCFDNPGSKNANGIYNDYRDIPIVGFSYCAKDMGFVLLSEIDKSEVSKPIDDLRNRMIEISSSSSFILVFSSIAIVILIITWNKNLKKAVTTNTSELKTAMQNLYKANEQLKKHEELQKEFINIAAHELRTPTQAIIGYIELLQSSIESLGHEHTSIIHKIYPFIQYLDRNANRLYQLVLDILDISKIESGSLYLNKEKINILDRMMQTVKDTLVGKPEVKQKNLQFIFNGMIIDKHTSSLPFISPVFVSGDVSKIDQVLLNLLDNAIKFSPIDGKITINLEIQNNTSENFNKEVIIKMIDEGKGIDPAIQHRLFTKFYTSSEKGLGLGLYISKNIIELHGGKIWIGNNAYGTGAFISLSLPLIDPT